MPRFRPDLFLIEASSVRDGRLADAVAWALLAFAPASIAILGARDEGLPEWIFRPYSRPSDANGILVPGAFVLSRDDAFLQLPLLDARSRVFRGIGGFGLDARYARELYGCSPTPLAIAIHSSLRPDEGFPGLAVPFRTVARFSRNRRLKGHEWRGIAALRRFASSGVFRGRLSGMRLAMEGKPGSIPAVDPVLWGGILMRCGLGNLTKALVEAYWGSDVQGGG